MARTREVEEKKRKLGKRLQTISQSQEEEKAARGARVLDKVPVVNKKRKEGPDPASHPVAAKLTAKPALMSKSLKDFQLSRGQQRPRGHNT